jgi:hypothetical protein
MRLSPRRRGRNERDTRLIEPLVTLLRGKQVPWRAFGVTRDEFLEACAEQELTGLVNERLQNPRKCGDWPGDLCADLAREARAGVVKELLRGREVTAALAALAREHVQPILLKGTPLAYDVYSAPALRPRDDTDLLVRREVLDAVCRAMTELGYTAPPSSGGEFVLCQFSLEKQDRFGVAHAFDFHWKISTQSVFAELLTYDELAGDAVPVPALGPHARAAGPVHALLLACVHPVMHHQNVERLMWIYDIHLLASRLSAADFERFADLAVAKRVSAICARQLDIARSRFGTSIPDDLPLRLASVPEPEASAAYLRHGRRWHHEFISSMRGLPHWKARLRLVREVLLPSPQYMLDSYGFTSPLGFVLLPALYVHRNIYGMWKVFVGRK